MENDKIILLGNICPTKTRDNPNQGRVYDPRGIAPAINTASGGQSSAYGCRDQKVNRDLFEKRQQISYCIDANYYKGTTIEQYLEKKRRQLVMDNKLRIRKLTPKECWRLMGFTDDKFEAAKQAGISDSQLYKQAGNSIVTDVLYHIFQELYGAMPYLFDDLKVGSYFSGIGAFEVALDRLYADINSAAVRGGVKNVIVYDDHDGRIRPDQRTIGTLTTHVGSSSIRDSYKLIEVEK